MGQTDGQTDGRTLNRFMTLTAYYSLCGPGNQRACVYVSRNNAQIAATTLSANSLRQTVHTHRASVHQAAKLAAALLRVARVTAGLAESNGSLLPDL